MNSYSDIRDNIDRLIKFLSDINSLTENIHVGTNFEALLDAIREQIKGLVAEESDQASSEKFRQKVHSILKEEIERPLCRDLKNALIAECGNTLVVEALEHGCRQVERGLEQAIDWLHRATETTLRGMRNKNISAWDQQLVWEAAQTVLGWLVLLSVNDHWFNENKKRFRVSDKNIRIDIPARTHVAIEIVLSRNNEKPAKFISNPTGSAILGGRAVNNAIPESGWSAASGWDQIKLTVWNYMYGETRSDFLDGDESQKLRSLLRTRSRRDGDYYFTINPDDCRSPLNSEEIQKRFASELPALKLIGIGLEGESPVLLASEIDLEVLISEFLNIGKKRP